MKVVCISEEEDKKYHHITKGKIYDTLDRTPSGVLSKDVFDDAWYILGDNNLRVGIIKNTLNLLRLLGKKN
jgi:hypothetical protein